MENKVYSDQFGSQDMSGWLSEKTKFVIEALLKLYKDIDEINNEPIMPFGYEEPHETKEEKVKKTIKYSLFDLTKIYSFALGGQWEPNDTELVLYNGIEKLQVKYGLIEETAIHHDVINFVKTASILIQGERAPNRTFLHEELRPMIGKNELFDELDKELELVHNGEKSWEDFCVYANDILKKIEDKFKDC